MKKISWLDLTALLIILLPLVYLLFVYPSLPTSVPMHYGINGKANWYGSKVEFTLFQGIMFFIASLVYLLIRFLPAVDPKKKAKYSEVAFQKIAFGIAIFLSALNIVIIFSAINREFNVARLLFPLIGLLFVFLGNMMNNIKPNYFVGVRTPWTLESEATWRATHRLASKIWFSGGILLTLLTLLFPPSIASVVFIGGVFFLAAVPIIYSYVYFKNHQTN